ncbi:MAG: glycosyltransferase [Bacteroidota bacterium]|nr:glycosyltransferase [Bacteroidota bacterium]
MVRKKAVVFLACPGLGHINRGYESFTRECYDHLKTSSYFNLFLLKGAGRKTERELKIACIKRSSGFATFIKNIFRFNNYWLEQCSFALGMVPYLIRYRPSLIYYSDTALGKLLWYLRKLFRFKYKLLLSNGAPAGPVFRNEDHVQQLLEVYTKQAVDAGTPAEKQTLLPYAFDIAPDCHFKSYSEKNTLKIDLNLPTNKKIIISVGAINTHHKRMDYIVKEFSALQGGEYFLVLLGHLDSNSQSIIKLAEKLLQANTYLIKEVSPQEVYKYLSVSDYFILASTTEGFGRVLIEAQQFGLMPIVHNYFVVREVLKDYAIYGDLTEEKVLAGLIKQVDEANVTKEKLWSYAFSTYSWTSLQSRYEQLIVQNLNSNL